METAVLLSDADLARRLQDDYYYSLATEDSENTTTPSSSTAKESRSSFKSFWSSLFSSKGEPVEDDDPTFTPETYAECRTVKQRLRWIDSPQGQAVLAQRPVLNEHYKNGRLARMVQNKHWGPRLEEWLSSTRPVPFGMNMPLTRIQKQNQKNRWIHPPRMNPPLDLLFPDHSFCIPRPFPTENKYEILIDGFTVFRNIVPLHIVDAAQAEINSMIVSSEDFQRERKGKEEKDLNDDPNFTSGVTNDKAVLALFYQSPVYALVEALLHNRCTPNKNTSTSTLQYHNYTQGAQIAYRFSESRGWSGGARKLGGLGWHVDGMDRGVYGSFSLLIGFPLSDQRQDFCGNLCLHAGSHHVLNGGYIKEYATKCQAVNGGAADAGELQEVRVPRPQLDEPVQVKCGPGDVVMVLHKVGHRGGPNYSQNVRKMVYFRVSHRDHSQHRMNFDDMWLDYEGMREVL